MSDSMPSLGKALQKLAEYMLSEKASTMITTLEKDTDGRYHLMLSCVTLEPFGIGRTEMVNQDCIISLTQPGIALHYFSSLSRGEEQTIGQNEIC